MKVKGFYVLEHLPTGQRYTGVSGDVYNEVSDLKHSLTTASCKCKRLNELYRKDPEFKSRITEFPTLPEARSFEKEFRAGVQKHLLIN